VYESGVRDRKIVNKSRTRTKNRDIGFVKNAIIRTKTISTWQFSLFRLVIGATCPRNTALEAGPMQEITIPAEMWIVE
jgi:hypothetical protein